MNTQDNGSKNEESDAVRESANVPIKVDTVVYDRIEFSRRDRDNARIVAAARKRNE